MELPKCYWLLRNLTTAVLGGQINKSGHGELLNSDILRLYRCIVAQLVEKNGHLIRVPSCNLILATIVELEARALVGELLLPMQALFTHLVLIVVAAKMRWWEKDKHKVLKDEWVMAENVDTQSSIHRWRKVEKVPFASHTCNNNIKKITECCFSFSYSRLCIAELAGRLYKVFEQPLWRQPMAFVERDTDYRKQEFGGGGSFISLPEASIRVAALLENRDSLCTTTLSQ